MARYIISALLAMCVFLGLCTSTSAELTAFWRNNPITPEAIADDPALAGMQSWSVMVTNTDGLFESAGLRATLSEGNTFYRNPSGAEFRPSAAQQRAHPALVFHTYVTAPHQSASGSNPPVIVGAFPTGQPASFGGPLDPMPGILSVEWGNPQGFQHPPGTFEIVRLTFPNSVLPIIDSQSHVTYAGPMNENAFIPTTIPESRALGVAFLAASALVVRTRRRSSHMRRGPGFLNPLSCNNADAGRSVPATCEPLDARRLLAGSRDAELIHRLMTHTATPADLTANDLADVEFNGVPTYAKAGEWIVKFNLDSARPTAQVAVAQLGLGAIFERTLGKTRPCADRATAQRQLRASAQAARTTSLRCVCRAESCHRADW